MAVALALKNSLGLVCDPVAGLVEVPCVRRNAFHAVQALVAADMALAGVESAIPADEVIDAMRNVGAAMSPALKETSQGGLARTPTALAIERRLFGGGKA
jgi:L-serine dehydratase